MFRFLMAACLAAAASVAAAQSVTLVPRPPVYKDGESAVGMFLNKDGTLLELRQSAHYGPDKKAYVLMFLVDENGNEHARFVYDPLTWRGRAESAREVTKTLDSTCSAEGLYPITLGKVYECSSTLEINNHIFNSRSWMQFDHAERDKKGRLTGFCALSREDDEEISITSRGCFSPDGKWMRSVRILEVVQRRGI